MVRLQISYTFKTGLILLVLLVCGLLLNLKTNPVPVTIDTTDIHVLSSISPQDTCWDDLAFLEEKLMGKRIVVLGEATHRDGSAFLAKSRLIRYLHEELGFRVLAFEAGQYDMWRLNGDRGLPPDQAIYPFWSETDQMQDLWGYVRHRPIELAGFDVQCTGAISDTLRKELLFDYLDSFGIDSPARWKHFYGIADSLNFYIYSGAYGNRLPEKRRSAIFNDLDSIRNFLRTLEPNADIGMHIHYLAGISEWWDCTYRYPDIGKERFEIRDSLMAQRIIELAERDSSQKIILWMANLHAFRNNHAFPDEKIRFCNVGERLLQRFGNEIYTLTFTSYCQSAEGRVSERARSNSLEYALHREGKRFLYLGDLSPESLNPVATKINQGSYYDVRLNDLTDGLFFIDTLYNITKTEK